MLDWINNTKANALIALVSADKGIAWQHANGVLTDYELIETIRTVIGIHDKPEAGTTDINTGLKY